MVDQVPATMDVPEESSLVGQRIRTRRIELGLSQADVAEGMLSPSYVSLVESGRRQPAASALAHIAERLRTDVEYLRDGVDATVRNRARLELSKAEVLVRQGQYEPALRSLETLADDPGLNEEQQRHRGMVLALLHERQGDLETALVVLAELRQSARRNRATEPWLDLAQAMARCYHEAGDLDMAIQVGEEAMSHAADLGLTASDEYVRLGSSVLGCYIDRGDLAHATMLATDLVRSVDEMGAPHSRGAVYWNAAFVAEARGDLAQALMLVDRALALFGESDDRRNLNRLRIGYAWLLLQGEGHSEQALTMLDSVREDTSTHGGAVDVGYLETERARALFAMGRLDQSRETIQSAIEVLGDQPRIEGARARLLLARIHWEEGDSERCLQVCTEAAGMLEGMGASRQAAAAWRELGEMQRELGDVEQALDSFDRALRAVRVASAAAVPPSQPSDIED
ncbi:MAG TPA: tetratricopeptide repeat protein [Jiangellaceae bacterium]|nr:tetratricopeptide repeat protein [Jiangellaceae bacterium]